MPIAVTAFLLGLLSTTNPCILPLYPGFIVFLSRSSENRIERRTLLGLAVLLGVLTMMLALGGVIALLAVPIGKMLAIFIPLANITLFALGLMLLLNLNPFKHLPQINVPVLRYPLMSAYLYGFLYGPIALPCSGPLLVSIFALSFTMAEAVDKLWVVLWYGLGFGMPLFVLALLSGVLQRRVTVVFAQNSRVFNILGGLLLIGVAIFDLAQNW